MKKKSAPQSGIFYRRILFALTLCSCGVALGIFSLAATPLSELESSASQKPVDTTRVHTSLPPSDPANFLSIVGDHASYLPPGVPLPPGAQFSPKGQGDPLSGSPNASLNGFAGMLLRPETATPVFANSQPAPLSVPQPAASKSVPLAPPAAGGAWSIVNSPNPPPTRTPNFLAAVTCVSASDCWAVGYYYTGSDFNSITAVQTLIERWDGTAWSIVTSPNTSATQNNFLVDVTCSSASSCWAVGYYYTGSINQTLIERWDGTAWAIVSSPNTSATRDNFLRGVTCVSASDCWAVGYYDAGIVAQTPVAVDQTLIERWDGTSWAIVTSPNPSASVNNILYGVTCVSASNCWAVGFYNTGITDQTLIERWDGTSWVIVTSPNTSTTQGNFLSGVTCASASNCWAVGFYNTDIAAQTLIERWDGTSWVIVISPNTNATRLNFLAAVTCVSASDCWAVGYYVNDTGTTYQTLIERWDGTWWAIVSSPDTSTTQDNALYGVACVSASGCWAVGYYYDRTAQTLIERWDGTSWAIVNSPNTSTTQDNTLYGVTCVSVSNCWAVGYYYTGSRSQTLIEHWNGTSWAIVSSPNTNSAGNILSAVTCLSASDCWAVGYTGYSSSSPGQTVIDRWDGTSWTSVPSPNSPSADYNVLQAVTCVSATNCWAVGYYYDATTGSTQTLIEDWDGTSWAIVSSPNTSTTQSNYLQGVTCMSASNCWAVGYYFNGTALALQTLTERWDGTSWTIVTSPNIGARSNQLLGVTCVSASNCWAVGYFDTTGLGVAWQTLIQHWDGTLWTIVTSPNTSAAQGNYLFSVACASASNCWAVGDYYGTTPQQTLIEHWDGTTWAIVSSPNTNTVQKHYLFGVTCVSPFNCWAVGFYGSGQTLVLRYTTNPPIPTSAVSRKTHGAPGTFDINLPLAGNPGIECRTGGSNNDYQVVLAFPSAVSFDNAAVTSGTGTVSNTSGNGTTEITVDLTAVTNAQTITVTLFGVNDGTNTGNVSVPMGVLLGDTSGDGVVNSADITQTRRQSGNVTDSSNFREDVTLDGVINSADITLVRRQSGTAIP